MELREPANRVSGKAKTYWAIGETVASVVVIVACIAVMILWQQTWWLWTILGLSIVSLPFDVIVIPRWRYRVHRWEVSETAVYTQTGWLTQERRIAPISRVQTVDTERNALAQLLGLSSVTVTTASSAGALKIECLDRRTAEEVVDHLTIVTAQSPDDAT